MWKMLSGEYNLPLHFSACESGFIYLWEVPDGGLTEVINSPSAVLKGICQT